MLVEAFYFWLVGWLGGGHGLFHRDPVCPEGTDDTRPQEPAPSNSHVLPSCQAR